MGRGGGAAAGRDRRHRPPARPLPGRRVLIDGRCASSSARPTCSTPSTSGGGRSAWARRRARPPMAARAARAPDRRARSGRRLTLPRHVDRILEAASNRLAREEMPEGLRAALTRLVADLDALRPAVRGARGAARKTVVERLDAIDRALLAAAREAAGPDLAGLEADARDELSSFRSRLDRRRLRPRRGRERGPAAAGPPRPAGGSVRRVGAGGGRPGVAPSQVDGRIALVSPEQARRPWPGVAPAPSAAGRRPEPRKSRANGAPRKFRVNGASRRDRGVARRRFPAAIRAGARDRTAMNPSGETVSDRADAIELTIERPAVGGRMIARWEGRVVLVAGGHSRRAGTRGG